MKKLYSFNFMSRVFFLLLTPVFFRFFAIGFIWHSIYWGVITFVMIIWITFIIVSPLFGRIGCGWFCFMGSCADLASEHSVIKMKWHRPQAWLRLSFLILFLGSSVSFYFINNARGITNDFLIDPSFLKPDFNGHYKLVWMIDVSSALIMSLFLERRWGCKNLCYMGTLCTLGARHSRLIPVVDTEKCNRCGKCEKNCLVRIPIVSYISGNNGLITNSECLVCGKCVSVCKSDAIKLKFIWNRKKYIKKLL
jgi:ferredoxin-type protein NapH